MAKDFRERQKFVRDLGSIGEIVRLDASAFDIRTGLRGAAFTTTPFVIGLATGHPEAVIATLGALFLTNTEGPRAVALPLRILIIACFTEAAAFGLGTLVGTTDLLAIPLVGIGVFGALMVAGRQGWTSVGTFTAIAFAVGVGLPGGSTAAAGQRVWLSLIGALWAFLGASVERALGSHGASAATSVTPQASKPGHEFYSQRPRPSILSLQSGALSHDTAVGVASAVGLSIGLALGLPRDFWIIVTIIITVRPNVGSTIRLTSMMVMGTIAGAVIAAAITLEVGDLYFLAALLFGFYALAFATRGVNLGLVQVFLTPSIIILLNILYPGHWQLAETRVLDVVIGGAMAVPAVYLLGVKAFVNSLGWRREH